MKTKINSNHPCSSAFIRGSSSWSFISSCLRVYVFSAAILATAAAQAAHPQAFSFSSQKDFTEGQFDNTVVNSYGELSLGRALTPIPTDPAAESIQGFTQTPDNALYVATSPQAKIFRLNNNKSTPLFSAPKGFDDITTLSSDSKGNLLIALAGQSAQLLRLDPAKPATPTLLFQDKSVDYIWAILPAPDGSLYLATGPNGKIFKLTDNAPPTVILDSKEKNITALAFDNSNNLIAGTDANGLVIRIDLKNNKPFVLLDAGKVDINALTTDAAGNIYVATAKVTPPEQEPEQSNPDEDMAPKGKPSTPEPEPVEPAPDDKQINPQPGASAPDFLSQHAILAAVPPSLPPDLQALLKKAAANKTKSDAAPPHKKLHPTSDHSSSPANPMSALSPPDESDDSSSAPAAVYRISPDGISTTLVQNDSQNFSLLFNNDELLIGTGDEGKLFSYKPADDSLTLIARVKEQQISTLFADHNHNLFLGTGNMANVYQLAPSLAPTGSFTSQVLDASHTANFGHPALDSSLPPNTKLTLSTRTGNTKDLDANPAFWSDWSDLDANQKIQSPAARFLQFRITLATSAIDSPVLHTLKLPYQTQNLPPTLKNLIVTLPEPTPPNPTPSSPDDTPDTAASDPNQIHISWDANDPNNDTLSFRLYYKPLSEPRPLGSGLPPEPWTPFAKDLKDPQYDWNTLSLPDGHYQIKVVASDSPDNPTPEALETARTSATFLINHTPPILSDLTPSITGNKATLAGSAKDALSTISDVRYQIDGQGDWQPAAASDKIFDSPQEAFTLVTRPLSAGPHRITLRATDSAGNSSYKAITILIKP